MSPETPAQGIYKVNDWGGSVMYRAVCSCGNDDCTHTIDIEADDAVNVTIYTKTRTDFWSKTRWHHIWKLLTKGFVDFETVIILDKQAALNYSATLASAVKDVENFRKQHGKN